MINSKNIAELAKASGNVLTRDGNKIGSIGQFYADDAANHPSWVTVKTGLFGLSESFVPLYDASAADNDILVPYTKDKVKDAPRVDADGYLSAEEEDELYRHYEFEGTNATVPGTGVDDRDASDLRKGTAGRTTPEHSTDDAMTRSEEQVRVGTETFEAGRARLRKYVVTENVTTTVPVSHEEVRVEREPITNANRGDALDGQAISEDDYEVTLHEERPVVEKEAVPVERVRLEKETVTEQQTVSENVRKEKIETDGHDIPDPRAGR